MMRATTFLIAMACVGMLVRAEMEDGLVEGSGFLPRFDAQLLSQGPAARRVLGQRGAALPVEGQQAHQVAVVLLVPGFKIG